MNVGWYMPHALNKSEGKIAYKQEIFSVTSLVEQN
jgi:hypothetical protein